MPRVRPAPAALSGPAPLQLMWLASPALPVGAFSYSEGLEAGVEGGQVPDEAGAAPPPPRRGGRRKAVALGALTGPPHKLGMPAGPQSG